MTVTTKIAPSNSLLFIAGSANDFETPEITGIGLVWSTSTCVAVGTLMEFDGETVVTLSDESPDDHLAPSFRRVFGGSIETPTKQICVSTVPCEGILSLQVSGTSSNVEVWANDETEPDKLLILVKG